MKKSLLTPLSLSKTPSQQISLQEVYDKLFLVHTPSSFSSEERFTSMYQEYYRELYRYCFCRVSSLDTALDIVQETFHRTWQYLKKGKTIVHNKSFLYTIARNLIIDEYRQKKFSSLDLLIGTEMEPAVTVEEELYLYADIAYVRNCINQLPLTYKVVLQMRYIEDCSITTIAEKLSITENVVSVRIYRGLCKLRETISLP